MELTEWYTKGKLHVMDNEINNEQNSSNDAEPIQDNSSETSGQIQSDEKEIDSQLVSNLNDSINYETLSLQVSQIDTRLDSISNILIVSMIGIALIVGVLCSTIFARYFTS